MQTGAKCKSSDDMELTRDNGEKVFSDIYPSKVDMRGKSKLKQLVEEQMLTVVSTDVSVCTKLCRSEGDLPRSLHAESSVRRSPETGKMSQPLVSRLSRESCQMIP